MEIYHCRDTGLSCLGCGQPGRGTGFYSAFPTPLPSHAVPAGPFLARFHVEFPTPAASPPLPWLWGTSLLTVALENWLS